MSKVLTFEQYLCKKYYCSRAELQYEISINPTKVIVEGTKYANHLIDSISDGDIEIKYKDVVMMPKNNFQGTYNLNMPDNEHKREGAKWFKQTLKDKLNDL